MYHCTPRSTAPSSAPSGSGAPFANAGRTSEASGAGGGRDVDPCKRSRRQDDRPRALWGETAAAEVGKLSRCDQHRRRRPNEQRPRHGTAGQPVHRFVVSGHHGEHHRVGVGGAGVLRSVYGTGACSGSASAEAAPGAAPVTTARSAPSGSAAAVVLLLRRRRGGGRMLDVEPQPLPRSDSVVFGPDCGLGPLWSEDELAPAGASSARPTRWDRIPAVGGGMGDGMS